MMANNHEDRSRRVDKRSASTFPALARWMRCAYPPYIFLRTNLPCEASITLDGQIYAGDLPRRALSLVREWLALHRDELADDWQRAVAKQPLNPIDPLE